MTLIVMQDADIDKAVATTINQRFGTAGQRCTAAKRLFVHDAVYDDFKAKLVAATEKVVVGDPMDDNTFIGPVVNCRAADEIEAQVQKAIDCGATVLTGNQRDGNIIRPTILENITAESNLMTEEVFGPVVPLYRFSDVEEIIPVINNSPYGLQAGMFTNDLALARHLLKSLRLEHWRLMMVQVSVQSISHLVVSSKVVLAVRGLNMLSVR